MPSNFEKPLQTAGRTRKKSIFARKSSETTVSKPDTGGVVILDYSRTRKKKRSIENNQFPSNDSFPDAHSYSTGDQNTDEEQGELAAYKNLNKRSVLRRQCSDTN